MGVVIEVLPIGDQGEGADAHHFHVLVVPVGADDRPGEAADAAGFRHFPLQFKPECFHLINGGQLAGGAHLRRQFAKPIAPVGKLRRNERAFKQASRVPGDLLQHPKELPQGAKTLI